MASTTNSYYLSTILDGQKSQLISTNHVNSLVCGYAHEHEKYWKLSIEADVVHTIEKYCKQSIGCVLGRDTLSLDCVDRHLHHVARQCMSTADAAACRTTAYIDAFCSLSTTLLCIHHLKDTNLKVQNCQMKLSSSLTQIFGRTEQPEQRVEKLSSPIAFVAPCFDFEIFAPSVYGRVVDIQCGFNHILFLTDVGHVLSCGDNLGGQCGVEHARYISTPTQIDFGDAKIRCVAAGKLHSMFVDDSGKLWTCGYNYCGQLGIGLCEGLQDAASEVSHFVTTQDAADISATTHVSCRHDAANNNSGVFEMIDSDDESDVDSETDSKQLTLYSPTKNSFFDDVRISFVRCGSFHSLVVTANGEAYTFGHNGYGNLGNNKVSEWGSGDLHPHRVAIPGKVINGACGWNHNVVLTEEHEIFTFGDNGKQQCSKMCQTRVVKNPTKLSKYDEFGVHENCFVDFVTASKQHTLIICDPHKRT